MAESVQMGVDRGPFLIAVLGKTLSGKSKFINSVIGKDVAPVAKSDFGSCTVDVKDYKLTLPDGREAIFLDTPGFDGFPMEAGLWKQAWSDSDILDALKVFEESHKLSITHIFLLQSIAEVDSPLKDFQGSLKRVFGELLDRTKATVITTYWDIAIDINTGDPLDEVGAAEEEEELFVEGTLLRALRERSTNYSYYRSGQADAENPEPIVDYISPRDLVFRVLGVDPNQPAVTGVSQAEPVHGSGANESSDEETLIESPASATNGALPSFTSAVLSKKPSALVEVDVVDEFKAGSAQLQAIAASLLQHQKFIEGLSSSNASELVAVSKERDYLREQLSNLRLDKESSERRLLGIIEATGRQSKETEAYMAECERLRAYAQELEAGLSNKKDELQSLQALHADLDRRLKDVEGDRDRLHAETTKLHSEKVAAEAMVENMRAEKEAIWEDLLAVKRDADTAKEERDQLREKLLEHETLRAELERALGENSELRNIQGTLSRELEKTTVDLEGAKREVEMAKDDLEAAHGERDAVSLEMDAMRTALKETQKKLDSCLSTLEMKTRELERPRPGTPSNNNPALLARLNKFSTDLKSANVRLSTAEGELKSTREANSRLSAELEETKRRLREEELRRTMLPSPRTPSTPNFFSMAAGMPQPSPPRPGFNEPSMTPGSAYHTPLPGNRSQPGLGMLSPLSTGTFSLGTPPVGQAPGLPQFAPPGGGDQGFSSGYRDFPRPSDSGTGYPPSDAYGSPQSNPFSFNAPSPPQQQTQSYVGVPSMQMPAPQHY